MPGFEYERLLERPGLLFGIVQEPQGCGQIHPERRIAVVPGERAAQQLRRLGGMAGFEGAERGGIQDERVVGDQLLGFHQQLHGARRVARRMRAVGLLHESAQSAFFFYRDQEEFPARTSRGFYAEKALFSDS